MQSEKLTDSYIKSEKTLPLRYNEFTEDESHTIKSKVKKMDNKKKPFFSCCKKKKKSKGNSKDNNESLNPQLPGRRIVFEDLGSCPSWQNILLGEFTRLRDEKGYKWVENVIKFLTTNYGPNYLERPPNEKLTNFDSIKIRRDTCLVIQGRSARNSTKNHHNDNKNSPDQICYFGDRIRTTLAKMKEVNRQKTMIRLDGKKIIGRMSNNRHSVAVACLNLNAFKNPRTSNLGLIWKNKESQIGVNLEELGDYYDETTSRNSKHTKESIYSSGRRNNLNHYNSQPKQSGLEKIDEYEMDEKSSINTYDDGKLFQFLNRESDELEISIVDEKSEEDCERMLLDCYFRLNFELKKEKGFFHQLFENFVDSIINEFSRVKNNSLRMGMAMIIDAIKLFSCFLSSSIFKMFESYEIISKGTDVKPEEVFITSILAKIYEMKLKKIKKYSDFDSLFQHYLKKIHDEMMLEYINGKKGMSMSESIDIPDLLKLNENSLGEVKKIINGGKKPEYLVSARQIKKNGKKFSSTPYIDCLTILNNLGKVKNPYMKMYMLVDCVDKITQEIDSFYQSSGYDVVMAITAEELFPIIIYILINSKRSEIIMDILTISLFLTETMQINQCGFCVQTFMAGIDLISGNSFMSKMKEETDEEAG